MSLVTPGNSPTTGQSFCSIIIPVFNGLDYTRRCISALIEQPCDTPFELIVVDNGSTDGVEVWLETIKDQITLIQPRQNIGFARANNLAAKSAKGEFLLLLNNDTLPIAGWLDRMVETMRSDDRIGIVGAKLLFPQTRLIQHAGVAIEPPLAVMHVYENFPEDHPAASRRRDFQAVTAACMLVRTELYTSLSGFDEQFVNGFEDLDFCFRVGEQGFRVVYEPTAVLLHFAGMSSGRHDHEIENGRLIFKRWKDRIQPDVERIVSEDGFEFVQTGDAAIVRPRGINLPEELAVARKKLQEGKIVEAEQLFRRLYHLAPHSHEVIGYLERILMRQGAYDEAWIMGQRLAHFKPEANSLLRLAECALKRGAFDLARRYADGTLEMIEPDDHRIAEALAISGDAAFKAGDLPLAKSTYLKGLAADSHSARCLIGVGAIALTEQNPIEARAHFASAAAHAPHSARAQLGYGLALESLGDTESALKSYRMAVECDSDNSAAMLSAVRLLTALGRVDEAALLSGKYLSRWPDDADAIAAQADVMLAAKDWDGASRAAKKLQNYAPNHPKLAEINARL